MRGSIAGAVWLEDKNLQALLGVLNTEGEQARIVGGAVRNTLLDRPVSDIDIATTTLPAETSRRAARAGFKTVPTGISHGTITVVIEGARYEVTTLREDVETDGRHAKVRFGRDWQRDAERRDFTMNALYAEADGTVVDLVGGIADIEAGQVRFIGSADARIREDALRILRFFRFFAWYGHGRPDGEGLRACARLKEMVDGLSAERVWAELKRILAAPDPSRALLWMRQAGVLSRVLPESEKWGIDAVHGVISSGRDLGWPDDPMLRLESMVPPDGERMDGLAARLKLSNAEAERLSDWAESPLPPVEMSELQLAMLLYRSNPQGVEDRLRLALASARVRAVNEDGALLEAANRARQLKFVQNWKKPAFPLRGADLLAAGIPGDKRMGDAMARVETEWVASGFTMAKGALLQRVLELARSE